MQKQVANNLNNVKIIFKYILDYSNYLLFVIQKNLGNSLPEYVSPVIAEKISINCIFIIDLVLSNSLNYNDRVLLLNKVTNNVKEIYVKSEMELSRLYHQIDDENMELNLENSFELEFQAELNKFESSDKSIMFLMKNSLHIIQENIRPEIFMVISQDTQNADEIYKEIFSKIFESLADFYTYFKEVIISKLEYV